MLNYTKGEWGIINMTDGTARIVVDGGGDTTQEDVEVCEYIENKADAQLIAAAPDMHEALKGIMADLENVISPYVLERTVAALAKVEGK